MPHGCLDLLRVPGWLLLSKRFGHLLWLPIGTVPERGLSDRLQGVPGWLLLSLRSNSLHVLPGRQLLPSQFGFSDVLPRGVILAGM